MLMKEFLMAIKNSLNVDGKFSSIFFEFNIFVCSFYFILLKFILNIYQIFN